MGGITLFQAQVQNMGGLCVISGQMESIRGIQVIPGQRAGRQTQPRNLRHTVGTSQASTSPQEHVGGRQRQSATWTIASAISAHGMRPEKPAAV